MAIKREGFKFICEVPKGTRITAFGDLIIAATPEGGAFWLTERGLEPISMTQTPPRDTAPLAKPRQS